VHIGLTPNFCDITGVYDTDLGIEMVNDKTLGERITVTGRIFDGAGALVRDAVIEIWQADSAGLYNSPSEMRGTADPNFTGWGRCPTRAEDGVYSFETIKPGKVPFKDGRKMAPHITFWIVARGINIGLHTRMYFPEEQEANAADPILARIEHRDRVPTLIATRDGANLTFDIYLQGPKETVFLDI
jgi:protocatechuate 3,4-dioxygenase alpha subunit